MTILRIMFYSLFKLETKQDNESSLRQNQKTQSQSHALFPQNKVS